MHTENIHRIFVQSPQSEGDKYLKLKKQPERDV